MTETADDIERIRERKRKELLESAGREDSSETTTKPADSPTEPIHIRDDDHFRSVTSRSGPVLVDFHADWCGPCQMLEPTVRRLAAETPAAIAKVDIDVHQSLAQQFGVRGVPTLILFANGEPVERIVGVQDEGTFRNLIQQYS